MPQQCIFNRKNQLFVIDSKLMFLKLPTVYKYFSDKYGDNHRDENNFSIKEDSAGKRNRRNLEYFKLTFYNHDWKCIEYKALTTYTCNCCIYGYYRYGYSLKEICIVFVVLTIAVTIISNQSKCLSCIFKTLWTINVL